MKFLRNKFLIGLLCIAIGITVGFVLLPKTQQADVNMTVVVRLRQNVKAGTRLEPDMLEKVTIPAASVPSGASSAPESFLSRYSVTQLFAGDILTASKVRDTLVDPVAAGAAKGKQLVSVTLPSLSAGVSGTLKPGDVVSIMVTNKTTQFGQQLGILAGAGQSTATTPTGDAEDTSADDDENTGTDNPGQTLISSVSSNAQTAIPEELRYLEVCKVSSSDGTDALVNAVKDPENANRLPATITFFVTEAQALKLAEIEQNGELHITFLARGNDADIYIPREERVLVEEEIPEASPEPVNPSPAPTDDTSANAPEPTQAGDAPANTSDSAVTGVPTVSPEPTAIDMNDPEVGE